MGIYVKGMEMPKDGCRDCIFVNRKWHGDVCPILKREVTGNVERGGFQTDCPLVPVPPHGRLIDADGLPVSTAVPFDHASYEYVSLYNIKIAPTIIEAEEGE